MVMYGKPKNLKNLILKFEKKLKFPG
jgi:hypothetical protein